MDELWSITRVAEYLGVTERTVYNKVRSGELPAVKVGRLWRVRESDLSAWLARGVRSAGEGLAAAAYRQAAPAFASVAAEPGPVPGRSELEARLAGIGDVLERRLTFVALLSAAVEALGWPAPVVVGGHAVEFWTGGEYATVDIDLVAASEPLDRVLRVWGFKRQGRHWYDDALGLVVEAPGSQLEPRQRSRVASVDVGGVRALVLGIEDLVIDRLNACAHWQDDESCLWAAALLAVATDLDIEYLETRAAEEGVTAELARAREEARR